MKNSELYNTSYKLMGNGYILFTSETRAIIIPIIGSLSNNTVQGYECFAQKMDS